MVDRSRSVRHRHKGAPRNGDQQLDSPPPPLRLVRPRGSFMNCLRVRLAPAIGNRLFGGQWRRIAPCLERGTGRVDRFVHFDRSRRRCARFCSRPLGATRAFTPCHGVTKGHRAAAASVQAAVLHRTVRPPVGEPAIGRGSAKAATRRRRNGVHATTVHSSSTSATMIGR